MTSEELATYEAERAAHKAAVLKRLMEAMDDDALEAFNDLVEIFHVNAVMAERHTDVREVILADMKADFADVVKATNAAIDERGIFDNDEDEDEDD